jgi:iron complex transport system ATP-binding protein
MLNLHNLSVARPGQSAKQSAKILLRDLSLTMRAGERWCVLGQNGAGKSTLLHTLAGLLPARSGSVLLHDKKLQAYSLQALARLRAFCPQQSTDAFAATVAEIIALARYPWQSGWSFELGEEDRARIDQIVDCLELTALLQRDVRHLSGGERQRVALAATLVQDTPLLLLDEPLNFLDVRHQQQVLKVLGNMPQRAVVMALHDLNQAANMCTHALLLFGDGRWMAGGCAEMLTAAQVSELLQTPMDRLEQHGQIVFTPT